MREIGEGKIPVQNPVPDETALGGSEILRRIVVQILRNAEGPLVGSVESVKSGIFFEITFHAASCPKNNQSKMTVKPSTHGWVRTEPYILIITLSALSISRDKKIYGDDFSAVYIKVMYFPMRSRSSAQ